MKALRVLLLYLIGVPLLAAARPINLNSPNGKLQISIRLADRIYYSVRSGGELLLDSCTMALKIEDQVLGRQPKLIGSRTSAHTGWVTPTIPINNARISNAYNRLLLTMKGNYDIEFRAYNDGLAYRFITRLGRRKQVKVYDEEYAVRLPSSYKAHLSLTGGFKTSYENAYSHTETARYLPGHEMSYLPVLLESPGGCHLLLSEADLDDYPCLFIESNGANRLKGVFPKCPLAFGPDGDRSVSITHEADYTSLTQGNRTYPWRFAVITPDATQIPANEMVARLSRPSELADTGWIRPGQVSWEWWSGAVPYGPDVDFEAGCNTATYKYYIDFAARHHIAYILLDEGWALTTTDPYQPNSDLDLHEIIRYGRQKGVSVLLWLTWLTVENNFDLFRKYAEWGVAGVKIDFMDRSDQWMVNFYERVVKAAAAHHLVVDFHGAFKPAGLEYRYPNLLSYEGVRGMEQMGGCTPDNSLYLPFVRNAVGAMDYTPGAMFSMQPEVYRSERPNSASIGTRAYQMALYVVFSSGIQMLADNLVSYEQNRECTEFITSVPTVWDETRILAAKVGEYVVVARRKADRWYVGAICNGTEQTRTLDLDTDFLTAGQTYALAAFEDGINARRQAMDYSRRSETLTKGQQIRIRIVRNGGWAATLTPAGR